MKPSIRLALILGNFEVKPREHPSIRPLSANKRFAWVLSSPSRLLFAVKIRRLRGILDGAVTSTIDGFLAV